MNIRADNHVQSLDDEIKIFDDDRWDLLDISDNSLNFEFFNEFEDTKEFESQRLNFILTVSQIVSLVIFACLLLLGFASKIGFFDKSGLDEAQHIASYESDTKIKYVEGTDGTNEDIIETSKVLGNYFNVLKNESDYALLDDCCLTSSTYKQNYDNYIANMVDNYDMNDCYARALKSIGGECRLNKVNKVIVKDNLYYCYVNLNMPSYIDMYEYIYMHQYHFTKHFNTVDVTQANVLRYFLQVIEEDRVPMTSKEYCIVFSKDSNGSLKIQDDSQIYDEVSSIYTVSIQQIIQLLEGTLTN